MALDFNAQLGHSGSPLPHFPPVLTPDSTGVSVFAQDMSPYANAYVFPPLLPFSLCDFVPVNATSPEGKPAPLLVASYSC